MSFNTALSGIRAANADLRITGNNVANASTVGFKQSRAEFGDVYATTILGAGSNTIGAGVRLEDVAQQFTQGNISFTENSLDMAISGSGFFVLSNDGDQVFSRAGTFGLDKDGFIVNNSGANLQGFQADSNGVIGGVLADLQIQTGNQPPRQTTLVESELNVDAREEVLQREGLRFQTTGSRVNLANGGLQDDLSSTLIGGTFNLPMSNNFYQNPMSFQVALAGSTGNNGTVTINLSQANGMPQTIDNFNDLRQMRDVINAQLADPNSSTQDPIDVEAVVVNDDNGNYHLEFRAAISGESSTVSITQGNGETVAQTDEATVQLTGTTTLASLDVNELASGQILGTRDLSASFGNPVTDFGTETGAGAGDTMTFTFVDDTPQFPAVAPTPVTATINLGGAVAAATDVTTLVAALNGAIGATALNGNIQAVASGNTVTFETVTPGYHRSISLDSTAGNAATLLGLTPTVTPERGAESGFSMSIDGQPAQDIYFGSYTQTGPTTTVTRLNQALNAAFGAGIVEAKENNGRIFFESIEEGSDASIEITDIIGDDILGFQTAVGTEFSGGDETTTIGLPVGSNRIEDNSGAPGVDNNYPAQSIDIISPDGTRVTYNAMEGNSAAQTASELNALSGVSATATTTATLSEYTNVDGDAVLTLNNVALTGDNLEELATQINALSTSTLPGITATYDGDSSPATLTVTSSVGDDLTFQLSSADDGDKITLIGDPATEQIILEADPLNDGYTDASTFTTDPADTVFTGAENFLNQTPPPSFDIAVDGDDFVTVDLSNINNSLTTITGGVNMANLLTTDMSTLQFSVDVGAGPVTVDLATDGPSPVDGSATTINELRDQIQAAVNGNPTLAGVVQVNIEPVGANFELSFSHTSPTAVAGDLTIALVSAGPTDVVGIGTIAADAGAGTTLPGSPATTLASLQTAIDNALTAAGQPTGSMTIALNADNRLEFTTAEGVNRSLLISNITGNDVFGLSDLAGQIFRPDNGPETFRAEGIVNQSINNPNSAVIGGVVEIILDEDVQVAAPEPRAPGIFGIFPEFTEFTINEFDPTDQTTYNHATSVTVYDSLGNSHIMTQYFVKQPFDPDDPTTRQNHWEMHVLIDGRDVGDPVTTLPPPQNTEPTRATFNVYFNQDGSLNSELSDEVLISNWTPRDANGENNGALGPLNELQGGTIPVPQPPTSSNFQVDLNNSTQFGSEFAVNDVDQDGFATGRLSGISIDDDGIVFARFTNGEAQTLGQIALAEFTNEQGLQPVGNTMWAENFESGIPNIGTPGTAALGVIQSGAVEESNVDLSEQLVNLIIAQRNFQANSKTIETANQTTQTIINLR